MKNYTVWITLAAIILGFASGFLVANALNKSELEKIRTENAGLKSGAADPKVKPDETDLSDDEINQKIADAEQHAGDFQYQKNLGIALSRLASMKPNVKISDAAEKILVRANQLNTNDLDVLTALGNTNFDAGYNQKDNQKLDKARDYYQKVLDKKPENADVRTDAALINYFKTPPDYNLTIAELNKSLAVKPDNEKTLQFLVQANLKLGKQKEAQIFLDKLKAVNPTTPTLTEIATELERGESKSAQ